MGYPFDLYPAKPAAIEGHADALIRESIDIGQVNVSVLRKKAHAAESVDGDLKNLLDEPFDGVGNDGTRLSLAAAFAAGELYRWSKAITAFNAGVTELNQEYATQRANDFGVPDAPAGAVPCRRRRSRCSPLSASTRRGSRTSWPISGPTSTAATGSAPAPRRR